MFILWASVIITVVLLLFTIWWYFIFFKYRKFLKQFPVSTQLPLLGITYKIRNTEDLYNVLKSDVDTLGKNFFTMIGPFPTLCTADAKIFSLILGSPRHINKPDRISKMLKSSVGNSLIAVNGDDWREQRKFLNPSLDYTNVIRNINIFNKESDYLVKRLQEEINNESTDIVEIIRECALEEAYQAMVDDSGCSDDKKEFLKAIKVFTQIMMERAISPITYIDATYVFTRIYWKERKTFKTLKNHIRGLINRKKIELWGKSVERKPILIDILIKHMETDKNISEDFVISQLVMMFVAAVDSSAITISYLLYNLSIFPEIQQKAFEQVFAILGDNINQPITNHHLKEMPYLTLVIKESMRMKTSAPMFLRILNEDIDYEGTILPKGLMVLLLPFMMHMDREIYPEPDKFIPERFLLENLNSNRYSYTPFNAGVRNCIGQKFAMVSINVILAKLLLNYEFVDVKHKLQPCAEIILRSKTGIRVGIRKRHHTKKFKIEK